MESTGPELAELFETTVQTIAELAKKGIVIRTRRGRYDKDNSTKNYVRHLRETAAGRGGKSHVESLAEERARLAREQADGMALKNALLRAETLDRREVEAAWSGILGSVRSGMLAVTPRVQQQVPGLTAADAAVIDREIREALKGLGESGDEAA